MSVPIRLIVGLGNPGRDFELTRHNAGVRWLRELAERFRIPLRRDSQRRGEVGRGLILGHDVRLLAPSTFMNNSGESVAPYMQYFKIKPDEMLVAFDEVAFEVGVTKLKLGGGPNGHNGLRSLIKHLSGDKNFGRLRIGIGHPGNRAEMIPFLTRVPMPLRDREDAAQSAFLHDELLEWLLAGDWQRAMTGLHSKSEQDDKLDC